MVGGGAVVERRMDRGRSRYTSVTDNHAHDTHTDLVTLPHTDGDRGPMTNDVELADKNIHIFDPLRYE